MRILVVEDEHRIATTLKKGLEQERYAVDLAFTGNEGYDFASSEDYDLIILDLMLPGMDGLVICKKLRAESKQTPILMLTAKSQTEDKITGLDAGADDYLTKPFAFAELLARIRALFRRPKQGVTERLRVSNLCLNTKTYEVKRGDQIVTLSNREFSILEYLMRNANKIVSKDQLISHVWDYDADVLPNTVEVNIRNLRQKLGKPKLIQTARGFGYRIGESHV